MKLQEDEQAGVLVMRVLDKRIDAAHADGFKAAVAARIEKGHHRLVLDLSDVDFVDSSGLGAIVACLKRVGPRGNLAIVGAKGVVAKLFALTKMDRVFSLHETVEAAVKQMAA